MNTASSISIQVTEDAAVAFAKASEVQKTQAERYITLWLEMFLSEKSPNEKLFEIMREATITAKQNGLTQSALDALINSED